MNTKPTDQNHKALVTVFDNIDTAKSVVEELHLAGFAVDKIELVTHDVPEEAPEVETPRDHETTETSIVGSAAGWGGIGTGAGVLAAVFTPFPGLGLGMIVMGGLTGAIVGSIAGIDHAVEDDSVNRPTLDEYKGIVERGECLVVVLGIHDEVMRAEQIVKRMPHVRAHNVRAHIHPLHGHEYHEHPAT